MPAARSPALGRKPPFRLTCGLALLCVAPLLAQTAPDGSAPLAPNVPALSQDAADAELVLIHGWQERFLAKLEKSGEPDKDEALAAEGRKLCLSYEKLIGGKRDFLTAYLHYGKLLRRLGEDGRALRVYLEADRVNPKVALIKQQLSALHAETGHGPEALGFILEAVELGKSEAAYPYQLAEILGAYEEDFVKQQIFTLPVVRAKMLAAWDDACRLAPANRSYQLGRARARLDCPTADHAQTLALWEELAKDAPAGLESDTIRLARAELLFRLKRPADALALAKVPVVEPLAKVQAGLLAKLENKPSAPPPLKPSDPPPIFKEN